MRALADEMDADEREATMIKMRGVAAICAFVAAVLGCAPAVPIVTKIRSSTPAFGRTQLEVTRCQLVFPAGSAINARLEDCTKELILLEPAPAPAPSAAKPKP